jgi:hypothetical protein
MNNKKMREWVFVFFDMSSKEFTKRVRLHRQFKALGAAIHSQSVYCFPFNTAAYEKLRNLDSELLVVKAEVPADSIDELVDAYDSFISRLFKETRKKIDELEDAKILSVETVHNKRGYSKRLSSLYDRIAHLDYVSSLRQDDAVQAAVDAFRNQIAYIESRNPGVL